MVNRAEHLLELQFRIQAREGITRKYLIQLLDLIFQQQ